jgi:FAD/FMN-containing dehydrogenase
MNEEHEGLKDLAHHVENYATMRVDDDATHNQIKNLTSKAMGHIFESHDHHEMGHYKTAYAGLVAAKNAIDTASRMVPGDALMGLGMHPKAIADAHTISYRNAFFS